MSFEYSVSAAGYFYVNNVRSFLVETHIIPKLRLANYCGASKLSASEEDSAESI